MRDHYEEDMATLNREIMKMGLLAEKAIEKSIQAIKEKNGYMAKEVIQNDAILDKMEDDLCDRCSLILAREQPVAGELRHLIGGIKIITDLERIGDYAVHLAKRYEALIDSEVSGFMPSIYQMAEIGMGMVRDSVQAFVDGDLEKAQEIAGRDKTIDEINKSLYRENMKKIKGNEDYIEIGLSFHLTSRFLERLGDHVKNICEWIIFANSGVHTDL